MDITPENEPIDENDLFFFESDHLALRGNRDYSDMLKTIFVLEAQRQRAIEDFNQVVALKMQCFQDPIASAEKIQSGKLILPELLKIAELPRINWSKYNVKFPEEYIKQINMDKAEVPVKAAEEKIKSRPWTTEEQRKLEELLVKYPADGMESHRMSKIAAELGTRTKKQVASRLQKYYLKMVKAGLPVPGKLPNLKGYEKRISGKNKSKYSNNKYLKPSTFFPNLEIPVTMNELEDAPGPSSSGKTSEASVNLSNYLLSNNYHENKVETAKDDLELQIELVKRIKAEKLRAENEPAVAYQHHGYKCDFCDDDPIEGSRWHCSTCVSSSVDFCTDCMLSQLCSNSPHPLQHKIIIIRNEREIVDRTHSDSESTQTQNGESDSSEESDSDGDYENGNESEAVSNSNEAPVVFESLIETQDESYNYLHASLLMD